MNLQGKINVIKEAKDNIKSAIITKGVTPSGNISTYANAISQIETVNNTSLTVNPSTTPQTLRPSDEYTGYGVVNVNPVTSSIDNNIIASNIKQGVEILGVNGICEELVGQSKSVTENGIYIPDNGYNALTSITVNVPKGLNREVKNGVYQMPTEEFTFSLPNNATDLGAYAMHNAFYGCTGLTGVDLGNLTTISGNRALASAFYNCTNLTNVDLSGLIVINGSHGEQMRSAFYNCYSLEQINLKNLTTVSTTYAFEYAFDSCTSLTSVDLSSLTTIGGYECFNRAFQRCIMLESLSFPSLTSTSFGSYTNQFDNMLYGVTGCTVHFPSNLQSVIGSWSDVINGFGGTNTTVLFDLEATE